VGGIYNKVGQIMQMVQKLKYVLACQNIELALLEFQKINEFCELFPLLKMVWDDCQRKDMDDIQQLSNNTIYRHMHVYIQWTLWYWKEALQWQNHVLTCIYL